MPISYGTTILNFGAVSNQWKRLPFDDDFAGIVSLVLTFRFGQMEIPYAGEAEWGVEWALLDSASSDYGWASVEDTGGLFVGEITRKHSTQTRRFLVPFRPQLAISARTRRFRHVEFGSSPEATAADANIQAFWRKVS